MYTIHELDRIDLNPLSFEGKSFSGEYLMNHGLELPYRHDVDWGKKNEWASRVLEITAE
jgi:alpha-galactosidase